MNEKTLIELIYAYGKARYNHGDSLHSGATIRSVSDYEIEAHELIIVIERRINHAKYFARTESGESISGILDGKS